MVVTMLGGLALFLYGIDQMTTALKVIAGDRLKWLLERLMTEAKAKINELVEAAERHLSRRPSGICLGG